jgi:PHS family inorganic phosphate transporter-like MFS transporter
MGLGIGGDYPLSAVIPSEFASTRLRGRLMTAVFAAQGGGYLSLSLYACFRVSILTRGRMVAAALMALLFAVMYKDRVKTDTAHVDYIWRLLIGIGCVPGMIALYFRLTIPETPRFTMDLERNIKQAAYAIREATGLYNADVDRIVKQVQGPKASWQDFRKYFSERKNYIALFAAAYSWFALDVSDGGSLVWNLVSHSYLYAKGGVLWPWPQFKRHPSDDHFPCLEFA